MSYTTPEAVALIIARDIGQVDSTAASLSTTQLEEAIGSAQAEVNARLALQYVVPFRDYPDAPPLVAEITRDLAAFMADLNFRQDVDYTSDNEPMLLRLRRAQDLLLQLQEGTIVLTGVDVNTPVENNPSRPMVINSYQGQMFSLSDFDLGWDRHGYPPYPVRTDGW